MARMTGRVAISLVTSAALLFLAARPARADIYVWRDAERVDHYTNELSLVPQEYREDVGIVARDWARAVPPAAVPDEPARDGPEVVVVPARTDEQIFEQGYAAGLDASRDVAPPAAAVPAPQPLVQNVQVVVREAPSARVPVFFGPVLAPGRFVSRRREDRSDDGLRFRRGPAGPPPIGAAGPPPITRSRF